MPDLADMQKKLDDVRRAVRNLTVMAMRPNLTPENQAFIKDLEQSARAKLRLRSILLKYWTIAQTAPRRPGFILSPQEHRTMAEANRELGRHERAKHHELLARLAERRYSKKNAG